MCSINMPYSYGETGEALFWVSMSTLISCGGVAAFCCATPMPSVPHSKIAVAAAITVRSFILAPQSYVPCRLRSERIDHQWRLSAEPHGRFGTHTDLPSPATGMVIHRPINDKAIYFS